MRNPSMGNRVDTQGRLVRPYQTNMSARSGNRDFWLEPGIDVEVGKGSLHVAVHGDDRMSGFHRNHGVT